LRSKCIGGHECDLSGSRDVIGHRSRDYLIPHMPFPISGLWNQASISNGFWDIQHRM